MWYVEGWIGGEAHGEEMLVDGVRVEDATVGGDGGCPGGGVGDVFAGGEGAASFAAEGALEFVEVG